MPRKAYTDDFKEMIIRLICLDKCSTSKTAEKYKVPLKTVEKWVSAYHKNNYLFGIKKKTPSQTIAELKNRLAKVERDNEILKKTISLLAKKD